MRLSSLFCATALLLVAHLQAGTPVVHTGEAVAFLGDSITQQGAESPCGYVRLVGSGLAANGIEVKIIPAGISGHKSNQMRDRLEADVLTEQLRAAIPAAK